MLEFFDRPVMPSNDEVRFTSIPTLTPQPQKPPPLDLPFLLSRTRNSLTQLGHSLKTRSFLERLGPNFSLFWSIPFNLSCCFDSTNSSRRRTRVWISKSALLCAASLSFSESGAHEEKEKSFVGKSPLLCSASLSLTESTLEGKEIQPHKLQSVSRYDEERVLISEVLVRNKDGEELERKDLEMEALSAIRASRANSALTAREVQEDVHRIIDSGYFSSCMPVAVDTRDGIRLMFQVSIMYGTVEL